jgi:hypothetical protein
VVAVPEVDVTVVVVVQAVWLFGELLEFQQDHILSVLELVQDQAEQTMLVQPTAQPQHLVDQQSLQ